MAYADALAGIEKPTWASVSDSVHMPMNAKAFAGLGPNCPQGFMEACFLLFTGQNVDWVVSVLININ